jgi:hypothetical protein
LNLTANSEAISGLQTQPSTTDTWLQGTVSFTINTARLRNGVYEIRPVGLIDNGSGSTLMQESLGPVLRLRLQNELTFAGFVDGWGMERVDEWAEDFSAVWQINAVSAHPQCEYKIAIFDSADRLLYHTENAQTAGIYGTVDYEWDLVQDDGQTYSPPDGSVVYAHVTTFWPNEAAYLGGHPGSGSSGTVRTPPSENISPDDDWPDTGSWIIAVQSGDPKQVQLMDEFAKAWDENYGVLEGGLWALPKPGEPGSKREMSKAYRLPFDAPDSDGWAAQAAEWRFLQTSVLPEHTARNMWLIAHGGPSHMGGDFKWMTSVDSWKVCDWGDFTGITEKETSSALERV